MKQQMLHKYTIFEIKAQLAEMEKQYGKEAVEQLVGAERSAEIEREFEKQIAERVEPYWNDVVAYENGGFWTRLRIQLKYAFSTRRAECRVPKYVLEALVDDMMPDIRAFFESEEGKREFEEWKAEREKKAAEKNKKSAAGD